MSIVSIPSIQIPSNEMLIQKQFIYLNGGITPIEKDNSTWITVIYELWTEKAIENDIRDRIIKLELLSLDEVDDVLLNIKEGIRVLGERLKNNTYLIENYKYILKYKEDQIENKRYDINIKKEQLIKRMEKFRQDLETRQASGDNAFGDMIDKEKKEISKETSDIRKMGANRECLKQIGRVMKTVYNQISKILEA
jgi:hypothetical protein